MTVTPTPDASPEVATEDDLRSRYHSPARAVLEKSRPKVDPQAAAFLATCPLMVLATSSATGADASPRGGPPGFVVVLDEEHVAFADLSGNNRLDSYSNLLDRPAVGMLFLVPGLGETLRINGQASITTDPDVLARTAIDGVVPKVAVVVAVEECFIHCAKAVRRSGVWEPSTWLSDEERVTAGEVIVDQFQLPYDAAVIDADLEKGYQATLWLEGGR